MMMERGLGINTKVADIKKKSPAKDTSPKVNSGGKV